MVTKLETLQVCDEEAKLYETLANGKVAIIRDGDALGFITKVDLINQYKTTFVANN